METIGISQLLEDLDPTVQSTLLLGPFADVGLEASGQMQGIEFRVLSF